LSKITHILIPAILLVLLAAACGGQQTPGPGPNSPSENLEDPVVQQTEPTPIPPPTATLAPTADPAVEPLAEQTLLNLTYTLPDIGQVTLVGGSYEDTANMILVVTGEQPIYALGDLNGDGNEDAVIIMVANTGGSGRFVFMMAVTNGTGGPQNVAATFMGDRVLVNSLTIEDGQVLADVTTQGPDDALCCPTLDVKQVYALRGNGLILVSEEAAPLGDIVSLEDVSLDSTLPGASVIAEVVPAMPAQEGPPGPLTGPRRVEFTFDNYYENIFTGDELNPAGGAKVIVYPTKDFADYGFDGNLNSLQTLLNQRRDLSTQQQLPYLPLINAAQVFHVHETYLNFESGAGIRYVTFYAQAFVPILQNDAFYVFQGLTSDGEYYVSATFPLNTPTLEAGQPEDFDAILGDDPVAYNDQIIDTIAGTSPGAFTPSLTLLDALIASIQVGEASGAGDASGSPDTIFEGSSWVLVELNGAPPVLGAEPTLDFTGNGIAGNTGCNQYFGSFQYTDSDFAASEIGSTKRACVSPSLNAQETAFLTALDAAVRYELAGGLLTLFDVDGNAVLVFRRA